VLRHCPRASSWFRATLFAFSARRFHQISLRGEMVRTGRLELPSSEWRSEVQPIYQVRETTAGLRNEKWAFAFRLRRGSLHALRERGLVGRGRIRTSEPRRDVIYSHAALAACISARYLDGNGPPIRGRADNDPPSPLVAKAGRGSRGRTALEPAYETARITDRSTRIEMTRNSLKERGSRQATRPVPLRRE
jgi:hypothetical protein